MKVVVEVEVGFIDFGETVGDRITWNSLQSDHFWFCEKLDGCPEGNHWIRYSNKVG